VLLVVGSTGDLKKDQKAKPSLTPSPSPPKQNKNKRKEGQIGKNNKKKC
jgi:hypothetical protein